MSRSMRQLQILLPLASLICSPLFAQGPYNAAGLIRPMPGPARDAGIYHVGTDTWTRGSGSSANLGPDIIFRADAGNGYWADFPADTEVIDEGILPGMGNRNKTGKPGPQDSYVINGFQFGYCTPKTFASQWEFKFYDSYTPCALPSSTQCSNLVATLPKISLPAGLGCWIATFDLSLGGYEFCMEADGGVCSPGYDGQGLNLDHFGWSHSWTGGSSQSTGPMIAGHDPDWRPEGDGTVYEPSFNNACNKKTATGLGSQDRFAIDGSPTMGSGCYWFGGYRGHPTKCWKGPLPDGAQFYLKMYTDATSGCATAACSNVFCDTHPGNSVSSSINTCDCSGGSIFLTLSEGWFFEGQFTYPLVGLGTAVVNPTGTSELCIAGSTIGRYNKDAMAITVGQARVDLLNALSAPGGTVPTIGGSLCNGNTWRFQWWHRDGMNPSRFSKGIAATIN
jgi:hypothetical protein